jgi:hypothetical protein
VAEREIVVKVKTDETGEFCHAECRLGCGNMCDYFGLPLERQAMSAKRIRLNDCLQSEVKK